MTTSIISKITSRQSIAHMEVELEAFINSSMTNCWLDVTGTWHVWNEINKVRDICISNNNEIYAFLRPNPPNWNPGYLLFKSWELVFQQPNIQIQQIKVENFASHGQMAPPSFGDKNLSLKNLSGYERLEYGWRRG